MLALRMSLTGDLNRSFRNPSLQIAKPGTWVMITKRHMLLASNLPAPFYSVLVSISAFFGPFTCISFHKFFRQLSAFSLCSSSFISALLVLSTIHLFIKLSFSPDIILCGWLGLKYQHTNRNRVSHHDYHGAGPSRVWSQTKDHVFKTKWNPKPILVQKPHSNSMRLR